MAGISVDLLDKTGVLPLEKRREVARLCLLYKFVNSLCFLTLMFFLIAPLVPIILILFLYTILSPILTPCTTPLFLQLLDCGTVLLVLYVLSPLFLCSNVILFIFILLGIMCRISN